MCGVRIPPSPQNKTSGFDLAGVNERRDTRHTGSDSTQKEYREYLWSDRHHIDVSKLIRQYRAAVNPKVNVFLCQVAGYQDTIVPEFYDRTYILGGWGEGLLRFAADMAKITQ